MSKKTLLNEGTVRRLMKLASIDALSENFIDQLPVVSEDEKQMKEEEVNEEEVSEE